MKSAAPGTSVTMANQLKAKDVAKLREKIASRASFFGGSVSTRAQCANPEWLAIPAPKPAAPAPKAGAKPACASAVDAKKKNAAPGAKPPAVQPKTPVDAEEARRQRLRASRNFDDEEPSDASAKTGPPPSLLDQLAQRLTGKEAAAKVGPSGRAGAARLAIRAAEVAAPRAGGTAGIGMRPPAPARPAAGTCGGQPPEKRVKTIERAPAGKRGAAGRAMATEPQTAGSTRKQLAEAAMRRQMAAMRSAAPGPMQPALSPGARPLSVKPSARASGPEQAITQAAGHMRPPPASRMGPEPRQPVGAALQRLQSQPANLVPFSRPRAANLPVPRTTPPFAEEQPWWQHAAERAGLAPQHGSKRPRREMYGDASESDGDDGFVVDDGGAAEDWRKELRGVTGYDPNKYAGERADTRGMEAGWAACQADEQRSLRAGRDADRADMAAEAAAKAAKAARLAASAGAPHKKKRRPDGPAFAL